MSASLEWQRDQAGEYYYWLREEDCYVYSTGRRYYPATRTWKEPSAQTRAALSQHIRDSQTPRTPIVPLLGPSSVSPSTYVSYTVSRRREQSSSCGSDRQDSPRQRDWPAASPVSSSLSDPTFAWHATIVNRGSSLGEVSTPTGLSPSSAQTRPGIKRPLASVAPSFDQRSDDAHSINTAEDQSARPDSSVQTISTSAIGVLPTKQPSSGATASKHRKIDDVASSVVRSIHGAIHSTPRNFEPLHPRYERRKNDFFTVFRVFKMCWAQPTDVGNDSGAESKTEPLPRQYERLLPTSVVRDKRFGQYIFTKIRWFIVVKEGQDKCLCVPIVTYQGKGVRKGVIKSEHAIAHTSRNAPDPSPEEQTERHEKPMRRPIRIIADERGDQLLDMSRIDYGRVYTVEQNIKAAPFGWVHEASREFFQHDFLAVFMGDVGFDEWKSRRGVAKEDSESEEDESGDSDNSAEDSDDDDKIDVDEEYSRTIEDRKHDPNSDQPKSGTGHRSDGWQNHPRASATAMPAHAQETPPDR